MLKNFNIPKLVYHSYYMLVNNLFHIIMAKYAN